MVNEITIAQVKKHKNRKSAWIIIHNDVYDVTPFLAEHPGGEDTLLEVAGKDGTLAFEDVGHSDDARQLMKKFKIGTLPISEHSKTVVPCKSNCPNCTAVSCPAVEKGKKTKKSSRTYDGSPSSSFHAPKSPHKEPHSPKAERRVQSIVVPRESSKLKYVILALAGAIIIGLALRKYMAT